MYLFIDHVQVSVKLKGRQGLSSLSELFCRTKIQRYQTTAEIVPECSRTRLTLFGA